MDIITAKLGANMALKELGIVKATTKAYEYDGTPVDGKTYVKISNDTPDLNTYSKVLVCEEDAWMEIPQEYLSVVSEENATALVMGDDKWFLVNTTDEGIPEGAGLYAIAAEVPIRLEFSSAAKPIDPKYLPSGGYPVVHITTLPTADGAALTAEETAEVERAFASGNEFAIVRFNAAELGFGFSPIVCGLTEGDGMKVYMGEFYSDGKQTLFAVGDLGGTYGIMLI